MKRRTTGRKYRNVQVVVIVPSDREGLFIIIITFSEVHTLVRGAIALNSILSFYGLGSLRCFYYVDCYIVWVHFMHYCASWYV